MTPAHISLITHHDMHECRGACRASIHPSELVLQSLSTSNLEISERWSRSKMSVFFFVSKRKQAPLFVEGHRCPKPLQTIWWFWILIPFCPFCCCCCCSCCLLLVSPSPVHKNKLALKRFPGFFTLNPKKPSHGLVFFHSFSFFNISASPLTVPGVRSKNHPVETGFQREKFLAGEGSCKRNCLYCFS